MTADFDFQCTICAKCCHDLRLPLTVSEALAWLERGNDVQILCDASPWLEEPPADNLQAAYRRRRTFATTSGTLPTRIAVILTATFAGPCPNLQPDNRCGIYDQRPLTCRIYPAEVNPFIELTPEHKACPPEAWTPGLPPLLRAGKLVDESVHATIQQSRALAESEVQAKQQLCGLLGIDHAAIWNEGFVAYSPACADLLTALRQLSNGIPTPPPSPAWHFVSNRRTTVEALSTVGASSSAAQANDTTHFEYLGFFPASE
ncbi:YkgJ family cysteine cluster protein [Paraburkholderia sp. ZP32-5]|uniref:YkgJ family cysteine cluster protein n=1 Tax=Paraburkholderia sp. ZP32-5 TaxID=2883245 RepID=UPI001F2E01BB|nr:YkgJ family cysteine cluster protein [Paraburkholderia sp. ZP32-5]